MADKSVLWAYQNVYEPVQGFDGSWIINYKDFDGAWKQQSFPDRKRAYENYFAKVKAFQAYYNVFLRESGVQR